MKVCRTYNDIVSGYHFNPISDMSLFDNIETQVSYNEDDLYKKKDNIYDYRINFHNKSSERYNEALKKYESDTFMKRIINIIYSIGLHPFYISSYSFGNVVFDSNLDSALLDKLNNLFKKLKSKYAFPLRLHIIVSENHDVLVLVKKLEQIIQ